MKSCKILVSITGRNAAECISKIKELAKYQVPEVALFLEVLDVENRKQVYEFLSDLKIKIPLVHLRQDMTRDELMMLSEKYKVKYFTIHEDHFKIIKNWHGFYKKLYLEMSTDDYVAKNVKVEKIGGFCVDLAHYKKQSVLNNRDFKYIYRRRHNSEIFVCNHVSGYNYKDNMDLHEVIDKDDFDYLNELPIFVFGKVLAIEVFNSIKEQLAYKDYILKLLNNK